jgi:hypothetical protein
VPELAVLAAMPSGRLIETALPAQLAHVAPDSRNVAFAEHMKTMNLER